MVKLLTIFTIVLALVFFPPAALALISNNAVPGDATYPIKRTLEGGIYAVASLNPISKAWFAAARSDRRFKEFSALISQGKAALNTLNELVAQTDTAVSEIKKIDDPVRRRNLINQLSESIDKYDQKLEEVSQSVVAPHPVTTPAPSVPVVIITPKPQATTGPTVTPPSSEVPKPTLTPSPTQAPIPQPSINPQEIDEAKKKLEEIKKKLEEEMKKHQENQESDHKKDSDKEKKEEHQDKKEIRTR